MGKWCYVKVHRSGNDVVVAVCDEELLGRELDLGAFKVRVSAEFYGGERIPLSELWSYIGGGATVVNAFGEGVVSELGKRIPSVKLAAVNVGGVPHVQLVLK